MEKQPTLKTDVPTPVTFRQLLDASRDTPQGSALVFAYDGWLPPVYVVSGYDESAGRAWSIALDRNGTFVHMELPASADNNTREQLRLARELLTEATVYAVAVELAGEAARTTNKRRAFSAAYMPSEDAHGPTQQLRDLAAILRCYGEIAGYVFRQALADASIEHAPEPSEAFSRLADLASGRKVVH